MKTKLVKNRRERSEQLIVRTTKGESLDYAQAELLRTGAIEGLFPFDYEAQRDGSVRFSYQVTDTVPLETYLKAKLSPAQLRTMLDDVIDCFERCAANGLDPTRLLFEHDLMRLDANSNHLLFAYLPAQGLPGNRSTVMDLLCHVAERSLFVCEDNKADAEILLDYLKRQTLFSAVGFKEFLESTAFRSDKGGACARGGLDTGGTRRAGGAGTGGTCTGSTGGTAAVFDFVKAQVGAPSTREVRASQSLAEQVASDVAATQSPGMRAGESGPTSEPMGSMGLSGSARSTGSNGPAGSAGPAASTGPTERTSPASVQPEARTRASSTSLLGSSPLAAEAAPRQAARKIALVRTSDGARFNLDPRNAAAIGRSKRCAVHVTGNPNVSRHHATITCADGTWLIQDEGALNRTRVNDETLEAHEPHALAPGDVVMLANEEFRVD